MRNAVLHLADLHLGAPVAEKLRELDPTLHAEFQRSRDELPDRLADWVAAPESRVGLVVIAGDLFHRHRPPDEVAHRAREAFARIAAVVPVVTVPGNHDEYSYADCIYRAGRWPGLLATNPEPAPVWCGQLEDGTRARVVAVTYEAGKARPGQTVSFPRVTDSTLTIAVGHGTLLDRFSGVVAEGERCFKFCHAQTAEAGYRYLALGHIHSGGVWTQQGCTACYPGPPVGPSPSDPGTGELKLAELSPGGVRLNSIVDPELLGWRWHLEQLNIDPGEGLREVAERLDCSLPRDSGQICVLELTGRVDSAQYARELEQLLLEAGRTVLADSRSTSLAPPPDIELLLAEESLSGEFTRAWDAWRKAEQPQDAFAAIVLREGLAALDGGC